MTGKENLNNNGMLQEEFITSIKETKQHTVSLFVLDRDMKVKKLIKNCATMYYVREMIFINPLKKVIVKLLLYTSFIVLIFVTLLIMQYINKDILIDNRTRYSTDLKYILFWKPDKGKKIPYFSGGSSLVEGQNLFIRQSCKFINCFITYNKHLLRNDQKNIDAVVFNVRDIVYLNPKDLELKRSPEQKYIFYSLRSAELFPVCNARFDNFFNWTWTYKLNSDIPKPFINIFDNNKIVVGPKIGINWTKNFTHIKRRTFYKKSKAVAWIVTKCKTRAKYQEFVMELKNELRGYRQTLDIFGPCGDMQCPGGNIKNCFKLVEDRYFFQLILEDTYAEDYVSEIMVYAMFHKVIPIILGPSDYNNFLPPGSYINAQTFDMKKLGAIIDYLMKFPSHTYKYFFDWKNHYYYTVRPRNQVCDLCAKLNNVTYPTVYKKFREWWNPSYKDACMERQMNNMFFKID